LCTILVVVTETKYGTYRIKRYMLEHCYKMVLVTKDRILLGYFNIRVAS